MAVVGCKHYEDGRQIPCHPACPAQEWPIQMFRLNWFGFGSRWKLRRRFRAGI